MNIQILELIDGAKSAKGLTVVIDVFRAMTVEAFAARNGAEDIIPMGSLEDAYAYKNSNPGTILIGERGGRKCPGFDYGNSPSAIENVDFSKKTIVHSTSAGTQGIANAVNAEEIILGSLVNAKATARYIKASGASDVSLVCMGLEGKISTREDSLCAEYIKSMLEGDYVDLDAGIEECRRTSGAKFFENGDVFPEKDFWLCVESDRFDFVLRVEKSMDGYMHTKMV